MRRLLLSVVLAIVATCATRVATAADPSPVGRWVTGEPGNRVVVCLFADGNYQFSIQKDGNASSDSGTYAMKNGLLGMTSKGGNKTDFRVTAAKGHLTLSDPAKPDTGLALDLDFGPLVGRWKAEQGDAVWTFDADGTLEEGGGTKERFEVFYVEPAESEGGLVLQSDGKSVVITLKFDEKRTRLVLGGGEGKKSMAFVRAADQGDVTAPAPGDAPKHRKFPTPPKLPGADGGTTPKTPAPGTPGTPATPGTPPPPPPPSAKAIDWDTTLFETMGFKVIKATYEPADGNMTWILETTREITTFPKAQAQIFDAEGLKLLGPYVVFAVTTTPIAAGERVRVTAFLAEVTRKKAVKAIVIPYQG